MTPAATVRRVVAAFDFDGTLTARDSVRPFLVHAFGRARVAAAFARLAPHGLRVALRQSTANEFKLCALRLLFADRAAAPLRIEAQSYAARLATRLRPAALERLRWHRAQGHEIAIVSAALELYLRPLAELLAIDHLAASVLETRLDERGVERFTGELAGADCTGAEKPRRLAARVGDLAAIELHAYGDSGGDAALLGAATHRHWRPFRGR